MNTNAEGRGVKAACLLGLAAVSVLLSGCGFSIEENPDIHPRGINVKDFVVFDQVDVSGSARVGVSVEISPEAVENVMEDENEFRRVVELEFRSSLWNRSDPAERSVDPVFTFVEYRVFDEEGELVAEESYPEGSERPSILVEIPGVDCLDGCSRRFVLEVEWEIPSDAGDTTLKLDVEFGYSALHKDLVNPPDADDLSLTVTKLPN